LSFDPNTDDDEDIVELVNNVGGILTNVQTIYVSTNSAGGYQLSLQMADSNTSLLRDDNDPDCPNTDPDGDTDCVAATSNGLATTPTNAGSLADNTWGYNFSPTSNTAATTFFTIPAQNSPQVIKTQTSRIAKDPTYVTFGAKITNELTAGTYQNSVLYTATSIDPPLPPPPMATDGTIMQTITSRDQCPTTKVYAVDARDNHTYWIQKIPNSGGTNIDLCWMLTNLAYKGGTENGGNDNYSDVMDSNNFTIISEDGTPSTYDTAQIITYAGGTAYTTGAPKTTTGNASDAQRGYLYNWCAAMGGKTKNDKACATSSPTGYSTTVSVCPKDWRLPTSVEFGTLYTSLNSTVSKMRTTWLGVYSGRGGDGRLYYQGSDTYYWSSTADGTNNAYSLIFNDSIIYTSYSNNRGNGFAVRCVL
jgi:uncharacterized protein (TIGR02145 family)